MASLVRPAPNVSWSRAERVTDGAVHVLDLAAVLAGTVLLLDVSLARPGWQDLLAVLPYLLGLVASFTCSAAYNMAPAGRLKDRLRRFDHAAIYLLIAGTYTPVIGLSLRGVWSASLLAVVWTGAAGGVALKLLAPGRHERLGLALYLLLGWVGVIALPRLVEALSSWQLAAIGAGGLVYTAGVGFHLAHRLPFHDAIWHAMVALAAALHFVAITLLLPTAT